MRNALIFLGFIHALRVLPGPPGFQTNRKIKTNEITNETILIPAFAARPPKNNQRLPRRMGARLYADIRFAVETARRRAIGALDAIRITLAGKSLPTAV